MVVMSSGGDIRPRSKTNEISQVQAATGLAS